MHVKRLQATGLYLLKKQESWEFPHQSADDALTLVALIEQCHVLTPFSINKKLDRIEWFHRYHSQLLIMETKQTLLMCNKLNRTALWKEALVNYLNNTANTHTLSVRLTQLA